MVYLALCVTSFITLLKINALDTEINLLKQDSIALEQVKHALEQRLEQSTIKDATITCYTSEITQCDGDPWTTASGHKLQEGDKVVANNCLPFGTKVIIDGIEYAVEDRKNSRYDCSYFDIWYGSSERTQECFTFGKQNKKVYVINH